MIMSKIAPALGIAGQVLLSFEYPLWALVIWIPANFILGYTNRHDKGQIVMYAVYITFCLIGIYNYLS